jgi:hypothetical protein
LFNLISIHEFNQNRAAGAKLFLDNICFKAKNGSENSYFLLEKIENIAQKAIFRGINLSRNGI